MYRAQFLTRKAVIQNIYQNLCLFDQNIIKQSFDLAEINEKLFEEIMSVVLQNWYTFHGKYENFLVANNKLSRCAESIVRSAFAELEAGVFEKALIINEYLDCAKIFCPIERKIIHKILDNFKSQHKPLTNN